MKKILCPQCNKTTFKKHEYVRIDGTQFRVCQHCPTIVEVGRISEKEYKEIFGFNNERYEDLNAEVKYR